jgi:cyclic pyranopterin phosphate synthase
MPEEVDFIDRAEILDFEEIARFVRIVSKLGITKLRLTGGEPLLRKQLPELVKQLAAIDGINDLGMTTNGIGLDRLAAPLKDAGLHRLNISLDTFDQQKFHGITRRDAMDKVWDGIDAAEAAGYATLKINAVAIRDFTDEEIPSFIRLVRERNHQVRFIEFMPLDADNIWERQRVLPGREIVESINALCPIEPISNSKKEPATLYRFRDGIGGNIGIIPSVTEPFCDHCNRIRITSDGKLRTCLFSIVETNIKKLLRGGASDKEIASVVVQAVHRKEPGHKINHADFVKPERAMFSIGG